jgi:hypothetical protein
MPVTGPFFAMSPNLSRAWISRLDELISRLFAEVVDSGSRDRISAFGALDTLAGHPIWILISHGSSNGLMSHLKTSPPQRCGLC